MVTTSWSLEAQLELLTYTLCDSVEALESLVTMLEMTGRVKHIKCLTWNRTPWSITYGRHPGATNVLPEATAACSRALGKVVERLVKLGPVLEELETLGNSDVDDADYILLEKNLQQSKLCVLLVLLRNNSLAFDPDF